MLFVGTCVGPPTPEAAHVPHIPGRLWPGDKERLAAGLTDVPHISLGQVLLRHEMEPKEVPDAPVSHLTPCPRNLLSVHCITRPCWIFKIFKLMGKRFRILILPLQESQSQRPMIYVRVGE